MRGTGRLFVAMALAGVGLVPAQIAQAQAGQQDRMRQHLQQLDQQVQRMDQLRQRLQTLDQTLLKQRDMLRDQTRIQQHDQLHEMCAAMDGTVQQLQRNMERTREMARNPLFGSDPQMAQEMEQLRVHWEQMGAQMEQGLGILERLQKRLGGA